MTHVNSNTIVKNTAFLYLRMFLTMAVSLYTVRVVLQTLTDVDYGIYSAVGGIVSTFAVVSSVLTNASQRFFSYGLGKENSVNNTQSLFSTIFYTYVVLAFIIIVLLETIGIWFLQNKMTIPTGRENAAMWVFQCSLLSFMVSLITNPFGAMIIAKERMNIYAYISIADVILKLLIVYCITSFNYDHLKVYAVLMALAQISINVIYIVFCKKIAPEVKLLRTIDRGTIKSVFSYSSWTLFGALAGMCNTQGINIVLNVFFGPIANAAYSISQQVSGAVVNFAGNFSLAIKPPLIKSYAAEDYSSVMKLFNFGTKTTFVLMYMLILPIFVCAPGILKIWLGDVGEHMVDFVRLTLIYSLIVTLSNPITNIVQAAGRVKIYHGFVDGFTLLSLPITILLYKLGMEINTCYVTIIVIFSIAHIIRLFVLKKVFSPFSIRKYIKNLIIPMLLIAVASAMFMWFTKGWFEENIIETILCCAAAFLLVVSLSFFFLFSKNERQYVIKIIKTKILMK